MSIYTQAKYRFPGRPRHPLGLYVPTAKLSSRGFVPTRRERARFAGKKPFDIVFGGAQDDISLGSNQSIQLRYTVQSDFIALQMMVSATLNSQALPGCRVEVLDLANMPGKGKRLASTGGVNNVNIGGSGQHPKYFRHPYTFKAGRTIIVRIQNLRAATNNIQVVISGVVDE